MATVATRYWHALDDGRVQCDLCPRACKLRPGQRGLCYIRARRADQIVLTAYGRCSGLCVDPIEKKPLFHFLPGTAVLSFGTAGCNLACRFCQNWELSKATTDDVLAFDAEPDAIAETAAELRCRSVAFTYNDPVPFHEYALDVAASCRAVGIRTVAVTAGYVEPAPRAEFYSLIDAANVDLKSFADDTYRRLCGGRLGPVLDTLEYLVADTDVWIEVTTLIIPGINDTPSEIASIAGWMARHLGPDVPLHLSAFHPAYRMRDRPATPLGALRASAAIARDEGLRFVYTGNVTDPSGHTTRCPVCATPVIGRDGYRITGWAIGDGACRRCGTAVPGVFENGPGSSQGRRNVAPAGA
jgi:pyruvate formate lyase activating enzyme